MSEPVIHYDSRRDSLPRSALVADTTAYEVGSYVMARDVHTHTRTPMLVTAVDRANDRVALASPRLWRAP